MSYLLIYLCILIAIELEVWKFFETIMIKNACLRFILLLKSVTEYVVKK